MDSPKKQVCISLPESLYQDLISYQKQQQLESTDSAVVDILTQFFQENEESKCYATVEQLEVLSGTVMRLSEQVAALSQPQQATPVRPSAAKPTTPSPKRGQPSAFTVVNSDLEDYDDEPDEILYDFL